MPKPIQPAIAAALAFCALSAPSLSHAAPTPPNPPLPPGTVDCAPLWADTRGASLPCLEYTGSNFPTTVNGVEMRIFHYALGWNNETSQLELLAAVSDEARVAVEYFSRFWALPKIYFFLYNEVTDSEFATARWQPASSPDSCRVSLYFNIPNDRELALSITAHEIFHCLQGHSLRYPVSQEKAADGQSWSWWAEGSATAMASRVALNAPVHLADGALYRPAQPLYLQPRSYSTTIFWDWLLNNEGKDLSAMGRLIKAQPEASTVASERSALARFPDMEALFHRFARAYTLHEIVTATYVKYKTVEVKPGEPTAFDTKWDHLTQPVVPFTINMGAIRFPSGTHLLWGLSPEAMKNKVRFSYRKAGKNIWIGVDEGLDAEIETDCSKPDGEVYEFLITSTADAADAVDGVMTFKDVQAKECFCKDTHQPLDPCLKGKWVLDDRALADYYAQAFPRFERVDVSGKLAFKLAGGVEGKSVALFDQFRTYILESTASDGGKLDQETIADGTLDMKILMQKKGEICIRPGAAQGTYKLRFGTVVSDGALGDIFRADPISPEPHWQYACNAKQLQMRFDTGAGMIMQWLFNKQP